MDPRTMEELAQIGREDLPGVPHLDIVENISAPNVGGEALTVDGDEGTPKDRCTVFFDIVLYAFISFVLFVMMTLYFL